MPDSSPVAAPIPDPAAINGDQRLSPDEVAAYMGYHARRNLDRARASRSIRTRPGPAPRVCVSPGSSASRVGVTMFFRHVAELVRLRHGSNPITILDLGCGRGNALEPFADLGMRGVYVGIDHVRNARWTDESLRGFDRELILADVHSLDEQKLPMADVVLSCTALEHIRDDAGVIGMLARRTRPWGLHAHGMPGEAALPLYGPHGWRQYSPADLARLFPGGEIYRYGGWASNAWHRFAITRPSFREQELLGANHPGLHRVVRDAAMWFDRLCGDRAPTIYGVIWEPAKDRRSSAAPHRAAA